MIYRGLWRIAYNMFKIGVLDSGIGGITTVNEILNTVKGARIYYYADNKNAPYGTKSADKVYELVRAGCKYLLDSGVNIIVLACNTATAVCCDRLRAELPIPVVGTEPALKPASKAGGKTAVMATPLTLESSRYAKLLKKLKITDYPQNTALLAQILEADAPFFNAAKQYSSNMWQGLAKADNIVLGCTHYCYLKSALKALYPHTKIFDGNGGVATRTAQLLGKSGGSSCGFLKNKVVFHFSGKSEYFKFISLLHKNF